MNPAVIQLIIAIAPLIEKYGLAFGTKVVELIHTENPTKEQWHALFQNNVVNAQKFLDETQGSVAFPA